MSVVNANIPLLLGRNHLDEWGAKLDFQRKILHLHPDVEVNLEVNKKGHFVLDSECHREELDPKGPWVPFQRVLQ